MDRSTFLRTMLGNAALLTLPPWGMLTKPEQDRLAWTMDCHGIFVFDAYITYYMERPDAGYKRRPEYGGESPDA